MGTFGILETVEDGSSFSWDVVRPVLPGTMRSESGVKPRRAPLGDAESRLTVALDSFVSDSLRVAQRHEGVNSTSTSLAALAYAMESSGDRAGAIETAHHALQLCLEVAQGHHSDSFGARLAIEILLRAGRLEDVLTYAQTLPISAHLRLEIGAVLAGKHRFEDACSFIQEVAVPERSSIEGYILALKGDYHAATSHLREALRRNPNDADSALNLSISLLALGARKKARAAAEQARSVGQGRADVWLHLLELVLADGEIDRAEREIDVLLRQGVELSARLLVIQARVELARKDISAAIRTLDRARLKAEQDGDTETLAEVSSNLLRIRATNDRISREDAWDDLESLLSRYPENEIVVLNLAQLAWSRRNADTLRRALDSAGSQMSRVNRSYVSFQIATLEGDTTKAADYADEWLKLEPHNDHARAAVLIALGIGEERWQEASVLARQLLASGEGDSNSLNNAAYVLAMAGMADIAVETLEPLARESFILRATLGLAHLAAGNIVLGMKLYRQAADEAEGRPDDSRSLMTAYQALIVRQLNLQQDEEQNRMISALALPPYPLPEDWEENPEFLRLYAVAQRNGYEWPLAVS